MSRASYDNKFAPVYAGSNVDVFTGFILKGLYMKTYKVMCLLFVSIIMISGCSEDRKYSSIYTTDVKVADVTAPPTAMEVDLVEDLSAKREEYIRAIKMLRSYYEQTGNYRKGGWAQRELDILGQAPQYMYITVGQVANKNLRATDSIADADELYEQADRLYRGVRLSALIGDRPKLRQALSLFNELIAKYPTSDKIDDAAYKAGVIYELFGDEQLAATYYQRAFQWNADTPYPARFKAALLMDTKLGMKARALELYRESVEKESLFKSNVEHATTRIQELTTTREVLEAKSQIK